MKNNTTNQQKHQLNPSKFRPDLLGFTKLFHLPKSPIRSNFELPVLPVVCPERIGPVKSAYGFRQSMAEVNR
jgi:hypothetical protein